jgi:hypothetical protein
VGPDRPEHGIEAAADPVQLDRDGAVGGFDAERRVAIARETLVDVLGHDGGEDCLDLIGPYGLREQHAHLRAAADAHGLARHEEDLVALSAPHRRDEPIDGAQHQRFSSSGVTEATEAVLTM